MALIKVNVPERTEQKFRKIAMEKYKYKKGALSEAAQVAIDQWIAREEKIVDELGDLDPVKAISGLLKHVKKTSVELQHEISKIVGEKYATHRR